MSATPATPMAPATANETRHTMAWSGAASARTLIAPGSRKWSDTT